MSPLPPWYRYPFRAPSKRRPATPLWRYACPAPRTSTLVVAEGMTKIMAAVEADGVAVQRDALQHLHAGKPGHGWMQLAGCSGYYSVTGTWAGTGCLLARTYHSADGDWASTRNVARRHESFFLGELHRNQWETL